MKDVGSKPSEMTQRHILKGLTTTVCGYADHVGRSIMAIAISAMMGGQAKNTPKVVMKK